MGFHPYIIQFLYLLPTQRHRESGVSPKGLKAQGKEHPGRIIAGHKCTHTLSQTHFHYGQFRHGHKPTSHQTEGNLWITENMKTPFMQAVDWSLLNILE